MRGTYNELQQKHAKDRRDHPNPIEKQAQRAELAARMAEFLARGGQIEQVAIDEHSDVQRPIGRSGYAT